MTQKIKKLTPRRREFMLCRIMARDICSILSEAEVGQFDYLISFLMGDPGRMPCGAWGDDTLLQEWEQGEYGGVGVRRVVTRSPAYHAHAYVRQLWDKGTMSGTFDEQEL